MNACPCATPATIKNELTCGECYRPLSVGPVRLKLDGQNICGRCSCDSNLDGVPPTRNYAYEAVVSSHLFPCVYKPAGCQEKLHFNDETQHETVCCYRSYDCPVKSDCAWIGIVKKIPEHFLTDHPELCMEDSLVLLSLTANCLQSYLLYISGIYFLLQMKCDVDEEKVWFNCVYLGNPSDVKYMKFLLELGSNQTKAHITLEERSVLPHMYIEMDLNKSIEVELIGVKAILMRPGVITCNWKISIDSEYMLQRAHLFELRCVQCYNYMTRPIYICDDGHSQCADCKGFEGDCNWCKDEDKTITLVRANSLESLCEPLQIPCRWCGCSFESIKIREHERDCSLRKYGCPIKSCASWSGSLDDLIEHLRCEHSQCHVHVDGVTSGMVYKSGSYDYIIAHKEVFWCHFEKSSDNERLFQMYYKGPPSLASNFQYELEVINTDGVCKVYKLSRFIKNRYEARVQVDEDSSSSVFNIKIMRCCESFVKILL